MMKKILLILILVTLLAPLALADNGVKCELKYYQFDNAAETDVLLFADTVTLVTDFKSSAFFGPFSVDIETKKIDSSGISFNLHIVTIGPDVFTTSKQFIVEFGLPAIVDNIEGKNNTKYKFVLTPLESRKVEDTECLYNHRSKDDFTFTPTANTDLYYVKGSFGEFYWDVVKEIMENNYRQFQPIANLNLPGKTQIYLYPCPSYAVLWDKRFGMLCDPTRNSAYAIYSKELNTADPFIVIYTNLLRQHGSSALFLCEGFSNLLNASMYDLKKIKKEHQQLTVSNILRTPDFLSADPTFADRSSSGFVGFLLQKYGIDKLMTVYKKADDLNLKAVLEEVYQTDIASLETQWNNYIDSSKVTPADLLMFASLTEMMMNYPKMLEYCEGYLDLSQNKTDTAEAYRMLKRAYFFNGNYYKATEYQKKLLEIVDNKAVDWMSLGSYQMMHGAYDEAFANYQKAKQLDTLNLMINFNIALYYLNTHQIDKAREILEKNLVDARYAEAQGESRIFLAYILSKTGKREDQQRAAELYNTALNMFNASLQANSSSPSVYMWIGIAQLGLYDYKNAIDYLQLAEFLETRPFYQGMIDLWLGKAYLADKQQDKAIESFQKVIAGNSADYHQSEARALLEK